MIVRSPKELALFVSTERKKLKLNQKSVGNLVGIKQTTVSAFENKPESTKLETLFQILSAVNLEIKILPKNKTENNQPRWKKEW